MESENPTVADGAEPAPESNEHDYAHTSVAPSEPPQLELPEPAVGAEVDCPGGTELDLRSGEEPEQGGAPPRRSKRPEDRNCCCCRLLFQRQGRSFNRRAVYTFTTPDTVRWVFPDSEVHEKSFICETCAQIIRTKGKRKQSGKRSLWLKPPETGKVKEKPPLGRRMGKKSKAALLVSKSSYKAAFQMLWSSKGARRPMIEFWRKQLRNEMKVLSRKADSPFHQKVSGRKPLSSFPWRKCLHWAQENAPLVTSCLRSIFPDIKSLFKSSHSHLSEEQAVSLLERRTVVALSIPLFTRNIWRNNFLQAALGAELRVQGCPSTALNTLNTMGLCQNKDTVRLLLHRLRNGKEQLDGEQSLMLKHDQETTDEEEEEDEDDDEEDDDEEDDDEEEEIVMGVEQEVEQEEVQDELQEEEEDPVEMERRRRKAKKQRREEKRKERRGKRKEREEEEEDEDEDEQRKKKVVVVRLDLLKGTSEVGRSDLSAP